MNWMLFSPELYFFLTAMVFLFLSMVKRDDLRRDYLAALLLTAIGVVVCLASIQVQGDLFRGAYRVDLFSQIFKVILSMGLFLVVTQCGDLHDIAPGRHPEFYLLLLTCTLAMMLLVSSVHFVSIYVSLELSSYSLYILVSLRKSRKTGAEAGVKYFLVGISASAVMLFGLALLYSATQAVHVDDFAKMLPGALSQPVALIGLFLTLCGFFFKLALFPFHFWAPDVYQGAANQVAAYIATASKVAAIAVLARMVSISADAGTFLVNLLVTLAIVSMTIGNLAAIVQKDLKRLLAFSSIAHAGYVLIGMISLNPDGYAAAIFYAFALLVMKFTCFMVVIQVAPGGSNISFEQLAGLHRRSPVLAMSLMVAIFALAGLPPTIGFTGKLLIFSAAMQQGYFMLVLIAMINVVISLYYYLQVVKAAYFMEPVNGVADLQISLPIKLLSILLVMVMVVAGIYPHHLIEIARSAARVLVG